ncbi:type II secretion system F family protein [Castellaniella sp. GW247-6E4]|uniref:type II secretion system F family protein n=1 Tax=Castellaniella sp. GW247-6E4 TaxID=3140380 RepID=UPI00331592F5
MFWVGLALAAVAAMAGVWSLGGPWAWRRPAEPGPFARGAWLWPWVKALEPWCAWLVSWRMRRRFGLRMRQAGVGEAWRVEQWMALRVLAGLATGVGLGAACFAFGLDDSASILLAVLGGLGGSWLPDQSLRRRAVRRLARMQRELPFMLDLMTLCVEAGLSLHAALRQVAEHAPEGPLRRSLRDALAAMRAGVARDRALDQWAQACMVPAVRSLVMALDQADHLGMSLAPILRAQAAQQRSERFLRAEKLALEAPVKMLLPMVFCIFPCTFLVIGFPVAVKLMELA